MKNPTPLATEQQVCEWLQLEPEQFALMMRRGRGPRAIRLSRTERRFSWTDVHTWARARMEANDGK